MGAGVSSTVSVDAVHVRDGCRRVRSPVLPATGGDHTAIYCFLSSVFQGPSRAEFRASLDDPFYEPNDRLLIRRGHRIAAHAHLTHRVVQFGRLQLPAAGLGWLGVASECRGQGLGRYLLQAAEKQMAESGAVVGLLRTSIPHFFRRTGWAMCGRCNYSRASARGVLARLSEQGIGPRRSRSFHIRPWRRWELGALVRTYNQNLPEMYGASERTEAYWQWLIRRHAYDQLYVALEGPDLLDMKEASTRAIGYAAICGEQIVELQTVPGRHRAAVELVARACGDAIEHDRHCVLLHAPPGDPLHSLFIQAGGIYHHCGADRGEVHMARLLDPLKLLNRLCGEFCKRAEEAGLPRPLELGLLVDGRKYQVEITRQDACAVSQRTGRSYLRLNIADFTRLVLGDLNWDDAKAEGRLEVSTHLAEAAGRALFPNVPLWRPPLDDLQT